MFKSIKTRLLLWLLPAFAVIMISLGLFLYNRLDIIVIDMVDHLLSDKAELLKGLVHEEKGEIEFEISDATLGDYSIKGSGHYFEIADAEGKTLVKSKSLGDFTFVGSRSPKDTGYFTEAGPAPEPVRLLVHGFLTSGNERLFLYVAEGIKEEHDLLRAFRLFLLIVFPLTILLTGIGSIVIVQLSLKPLTSFSRQIGLITEKRLHERVDSRGVDAELKYLASSFNDTLDRLEKAFQAQRDFLSDASHELRTPTAVIKSTADVTLRRERTIAEYTEAMKTVKDASERMGGLIDRLLKLSRLDAELTKFKNEKVSLKDVLDITLKTISPLAQERDIKVNAEKIEEIVIAGDKDQLIELFLSILDNSIKYNRPNGSVTVSMVRSREWAITRITDTGVGIASEALDKVFDRFYRADLSRGETAGTGLGLPIAKGVAESHGGRIEVESTVGEGSTFTVYLPLTTSP